MLDINISTPLSMMEQLKTKFKQKRLFLNLTQDGLSKRSGVTLGSLKRFESSGQISLESLLKLAFILECLDDFVNIANATKPTINSIDDIINTKEKYIKKRGSIR
ncbi:MAG: XRE family transcriptional regulator [Campylobacterota bacterium]|nr:XRE family transcriptional regulator [Campylobacterota bacterium]